MESPFLHKITIKNSDGTCVTSEILSDSLPTESQKLFLRKQFRILNTVLGIDGDKINHTTKNPKEAKVINDYIQNAYELALFK